MKYKNFIKVIIINLSTTFVLIILLELAYRVVNYAKSCKAICDYSQFSLITSSQKKFWKIGISSQNKKLGFEPSPNLNLEINFPPSWVNVKLSTDKDGLRISHPNPNAKFTIQW